MKKIFSTLFAAISVLALSCAVNSCTDIPEIQEELQLARCLTPSELSAKVTQGEIVTFNWTKSKGATKFVLELYTDETMSDASLVDTYTIGLDELPYELDLEADMLYYARVKAQSDNADEIADSHWAVYEDAIETYAIKSALDPKLVDRTQNSITISWTPDPEVDHIRVTPAPEGLEDGKFPVDAKAAEDGQITVTGLRSSCNYTLAVHFKSADRGSVVAWTRPDTEGATRVTTTAELAQAILDQAPKVIVAYSEEPYVAGEMVLTSPLEIFGEDTTDGQHPTIAGRFTVGDGVTSIHCESLTFSGQADEVQGHFISISVAQEISSISVLNCTIDGYSKGIYSDSKGASVSSTTYESVLISNIAGSGGDCFDVRQASNLGVISFVNCTMTEGMRTFFRIDAKATIGTFTLKNCTLNNLCPANDGNNNGILHIRAEIGTFEIVNNLFLNMAGSERTRIVGTNSADKLPTNFTNNWFYNCRDDFFTYTMSGEIRNDVVTKEMATANGGGFFSADPCVDSQGGIFNATDASLAEKSIGDPRWLIGYVEVPEDLTLGVTVPVKTWNLLDGKLFRNAADKDMVRDGIRFYVTSSPINFTTEGFEFTTAAALDAAGVPTDCGIGFKVNGPGSVVLSTKQSAAGTSGDHLSVSLDGVVKAAVHVGAENQKVVFPDLEGEHMVYLYGCGPVVLSSLQWSDDIDTGVDPILATPVLTIDKTSVDAGAAETINVTWEEVAKAASYEVTFNGKVSEVTETAFQISTSSLEPGTYTVQVVAKPSSDDLVRQPSAPAVIEFAVKEVLTVINSETEWGADYFTACVAKYGTGDLTEDFIEGNLGYVAGGGKHKFGTTNGLNRVQLGGTGKLSPAKQLIQFKVAGPGTLTVKLLSGSKTDDRYLLTAVGTTQVGGEILAPKCGDPDDPTNPAVDPVEAVIDLTAEAIANGDVISIYSKGSGINIFSIKWTPAGGQTPDPGSDIPADPDAINEAFSVIYADNAAAYATVPMGETKVYDKMTYVPASGKEMTFDGKRFKMNGKATVGEDGIPTSGYISFKVTKPGTIMQKAISSSSNANDRNVQILVAKKLSDGQVHLETIYDVASPTSSSAEPMETELTAEHLAGATESVTIYIFGPVGAVNFYGIGFTPKN